MVGLSKHCCYVYNKPFVLLLLLLLSLLLSTWQLPPPSRWIPPPYAGPETLDLLSVQHGASGEGPRLWVLGSRVARMAVLPSRCGAVDRALAGQPAGEAVRGQVCAVCRVVLCGVESCETMLGARGGGVLNTDS